MVKIGDVWDSTTDVLAGRAGPLATFAALTLVLPALLQAALNLGSAVPGRVSSPGGALAALIVAVVAIWGRLAITGIALDPETTPAIARTEATRRLLPMLGALIVLGAAGVVLVLPLVWAISAAGYNWAALSTGQQPKMPALGPGAQLYGLALILFALWAVARIKLLLMPVVLAERRIIGAIGRSIELTQRMTWKLIGVVLLYYIVVGICTLAAVSIFGLIFRLLIGGATANFLATAVATTVAATLDVVAVVFAARLYAAASGAGRTPA